MFAAWGAFVCHRKWWVLTLSALLLAGAFASLRRGGELTTGSIEGIEADRAQALVERALGLPGDASFTLVFHAPDFAVADRRFAAEVQGALAPLVADPAVASVANPFELPPLLAKRLVSSDGHRVLALVTLKGGLLAAARAYPALRARVHPALLEVVATGRVPFLHDLDVTLEHDLLQAELISLPLALLVLLAVFRSLVAAALPIAVGALSVLCGIGGVLLLSHVTDMAQYTVNITSLIGLGVAIDYSLFIVSRFRDELARGATVDSAVVHAVQTAGRAVAFSGLAVMVGLSGLLFYWGSYLATMGLAGALVVALAVLFALSFLPAVLALLGRRVDAGRVPLPSFTMRPGLWHGLASWVMRRPVLVLVPTLVLLLLIGAPFLRLRMAAADVRVLPESAEARRGYEALQRWFPAQVANKVVVAVQFPNGEAFTPERIGALYDASRRYRAMPTVTGVESIVDIDPSLDRQGYEQLATMPPAFLPPEFAVALRSTMAGRMAVLNVLSSAEPASPEAEALVNGIRLDRRVGEGQVLVGGGLAHAVDATDFVRSHTPKAVAWVVLVTLVVLFLLLGSVVLPVKAVLMNFLSIAGSFGALVWIFQEGHLRWLLHFRPGPIEPALPVLLFCTVFGLSMDYEVLMLSRMHEEWLRSGDNTRAVAEGLEQSAGLITSAASIMVAVFLAFSLAAVVVVKAMGLAMAIAVTLDATLVRCLIVPSTMRLLGHLNWWAPTPVARAFAGWRARHPETLP
ncbi:MAG: MMPL family transporter [Myxococcaceae bacterium]